MDQLLGKVLAIAFVVEVLTNTIKTVASQTWNAATCHLSQEC
jgi:hypothetical protein